MTISDARYKELMEQVGMPNSQSLLQALQQVANEVGQKKDTAIERLTAALAAAETEQLERLANWAISLSLPTGHADTEEELLAEVGGHIRELQERANHLTYERDRLRQTVSKALEQCVSENPSPATAATILFDALCGEGE